MALTRSKSNTNGTPAPAKPAPATTPSAKASTKRKAASEASPTASKAAKVSKSQSVSEAKAATEVAVPDQTQTASTDATVAPSLDQVVEAAVTEKPSEVASVPAPVVAEAAAPTTVSEPVSTSAPIAAVATESVEVKPFEAVVSDIEGTTTPISFVRENLFPYVTSHLSAFLKANWAEEEMKNAVEALRVQAAKDVAEGVANAVLIAVESSENTVEQVQQDVIACIGWQMKADRKIGPLKAFQGYMWRSGYANGDLKGAVYDDVVPAIENWIAQGKKVYIYSSGSIAAQKLLFGYSVKGDLLHLFSGHYDTTTGQKHDSASYTAIAKDLGLEPSKVLFLSDNIREIVAAKKAGLQALIADRPGNDFLSTEDRVGHSVITSFAQIPKA